MPHQITYDNLKTAVFQVLKGHNRREQQTFTGFRSHYLFDSYYCMPAQGHEKGGVESDVGFVQRNFFAPVPEVGSFAELNAYLWQACLENAERRVRGEDQTVAEQWQAEKALLLPLPTSDYKACTTHAVKPNPYSQVVFETNRYSVPTEHLADSLVLRAYVFRVEILALDAVIATHARCLGREQDILEPLHYLQLLAQRPGAFEHAIPTPALAAQVQVCAVGARSGRRSTSASCGNCGPPGQTGAVCASSWRSSSCIWITRPIRSSRPSERPWRWAQPTWTALYCACANWRRPRTRRWPSI